MDGVAVSVAYVATSRILASTQQPCDLYSGGDLLDLLSGGLFCIWELDVSVLFEDGFEYEMSK